ncbi:MAG: hypothetical protein J6R18_09340 [Kiritimatiellae bacterium]|nr:hypothetical protein [Kiritimatiellia bacterium]
MIHENALGKKNSCQCVGLRNIGKFLMPIVSVCCMQAWAEEFELVSASGETKIVESGTYTASQDLEFGALTVEASPVTFDFSANPSRKVVLSDGFAVTKRRGNVAFIGGEWNGNGTGVFNCGYGSNYPYVDVVLSSCVWTNLPNVIVGRNAAVCSLTLDNNSRIYSKEFRLVNGGSGRCALNILGGSGLFLSSTDTPFRTDTNSSDGGNGTITVAGDGSILSAPNSEFRFGYYAADQFLVVSNKASVVANQFIIGRNPSSTGSQVLVADSATLTAKDISIRNPGCGMTVSNATLTVDSTAVDAIKVGYAGRTGGSFVLSGKDAQINYNPSGNVDVFAADSGGAEFRIENGATWEVDATQIASKTSNSVFRIGSGGTFRARDNNRLQFGPAGDDNADPACSLSNRLEVCDGGKLEFASIRFSGAGNMLIVSNGLITCGSIQIGYNRPNWNGISKVTSRDCALVLRGERGQINARDGALQVLNGSVLRFEVPEDGYESDISPLKVKSLSFDEGTKMEIDCEAFMYKGGKVTLVEVTGNDGFEKANNMIAAVNASLPQGCHLSVIGNKLMLTCSKRRFVFSIR